ncbi:beta-galactosidase [Sphingomonas sp. Leaf24]|uniref:glycoside hydrolase family 43 protein n=1 Tax=unclassified Sphingomonas TaxID=196159 RepID=UPI0006F59583|nr:MULTISPECIES: glycoside hydrolase family 43 protein [unclassified Sphingomonas]KQM22792.1 beta-galactosidase [Sphingomonas sp. Leaf5]KQM95646.1 beta-galactosidase [Sphingomonas sp. Leaf24]
MRLNRRTIIGALASLPIASGALAARKDDPLLFAYFGTGKGEATGLKLAISDDGFTFRELGGGQSYLAPMVGEAKLMRDPFVFRGAGRDAAWHMVWTTAWDGVTIGHATSRDLRHWSPQRALPVMAGVPGTRNCWAPEAIWDARSKRFVIFWSSTVAGRFAETAGTSESGYNHRLWYVTTRDFVTFSEAAVLYDPGFSVIDGTFATGPGGKLHLIVKDETLTPPRKYLQVASAASPTGPFGKPDTPFTPSWVEGPMTTAIDGETVCYWDVYRDGKWGAAATRDFVQWRDVSARLSMPAGARHGSLVRIPRATAVALAQGPA